MVAVAIVGGALISGVASSVGSSNAASAQTQAAGNASAVQKGMYDTTRGDLLPYNTAGQGATNALSTLTGSGPGGNPLLAPLTKPITMDDATLQATPGYQFNLTQGLKSVQNAASARGLGVSGAALKGAATYATGLADSTYQNQFNNMNTNNTNTYNRLMGLSTIGENAAAQTGSYATTTGTNIGNNIVGAGNANAASDIAAGNAVGNIGNSVGNLYLTNAFLKSQGGKGLFGA